MLKLTDAQLAHHENDTRWEYSTRLQSWLHAHAELAPVAAQLTVPWCRQALDYARAHGIEIEEDVADFARLRALRGDAWLGEPAAQDILTSDRDGDLKVFQLTCLHEGVRDGQ